MVIAERQPRSRPPWP